jgi:putative ABC transport system permease protein
MVRRPMLRRLAFRDAFRRPTETALVIAGSLLGTALITGSLIVGDTLDASIRATATTQLGPVDEAVETPSLALAERLEEHLRTVDDPRIDGLTSIVSSQAAIAIGEGAGRLAEPQARLIEIDFDQARSFGGDPAATGITGDQPAGNEVALTEDLAVALEADRGDRLTAYLYNEKLDLTVSNILERRGLAGYWTGPQTTSMNAFIAPGTLQRIAAGAPEGSLPPSTTVLVSNRGDVEAGARLTNPVREVIESAFPGTANLRVDPVKSDRLDRADREGDAFGEIFLGIGAFAIVAGILLLINIFVMLSEERKSQLGMLRAIGMSRSHLVRAFVMEGAIFSVLASVLGAGLGIGVGWAIVKLAAPIFSGFDAFSLDLAFSIDPDSIITGLGTGGLIALVTVALTSVRISRINIIRAIRDLPEPRSPKTRKRTLIAGVLVACMAAAWFFTGLGNTKTGWAPAIAGPPLFLFASIPLLSRFISRRVVVIAAAALALFWGIFGNSLLDDHFFQAGEIFAFVLQGVLLTFAAVVLLSQTQETLEGGIRRVAARRIALRLSIAYPLARRFRTGLTLGMFALVIFTMVFISTLSNVFGAQIETATAKEGGYEILATANVTNPPTEKSIRAEPMVTDVTTLLSGAALFQPEGFTRPAGWPVSGIDKGFVDGGPPSLIERDEEFDSDAAVWAALLSDPDNVVIPLAFLQAGGGPPENIVETGDDIPVIDPLTGATVQRHVIAKVENDYAFSGVYFSKRSLQKALTNVTPSRFYVKASGNPRGLKELATRLQGRFVSNGLDAATFRSLVEQIQTVSLQFLRLMQAYLALGLLVGIAGLGVVMVRAVRERRRHVGVLRALGFLSGQVRLAFIMESGFVAFEGIAVGLVLALITAAQLISSGEFGRGVDFTIPWGQLAILMSVSLIAALIATAWPAQQASQIPPAVALRIAE